MRRTQRTAAARPAWMMRRSSAWRSGQPRSAASEQPHPLVALVTRLVVAQTGAAAAIGLLYSRRHLASIVITLMLVAALCGVVIVVRSGTQPGWLLAVGAESAYAAFGLLRFATSRYLGGTLLAIIIVCTLLHPAVAHAFAGPARRARQRIGEAALADSADEACGGRAGG